ncbi:hypothetical protein H0H81_010531 [Sphagnurus paluster]|uniref:Uncharacterized protein n=1 Tax=Sphagnurus paluster TaxID=117069 RepID=A0A9P7FRF6_9AGAR|nr:hypothetical protein H0H81_010531 [Sphagnurus paluster]
MQLLSTVALLALHILTVYADQTVTIFAVATSGEPSMAEPSQTFSPIGIGKDGATTYFNEVVASEYYAVTISYDDEGRKITNPPPKTRTFTSDPATYRGTCCITAVLFRR